MGQDSKATTSMSDLGSFIPGFESMSPRSRCEEVIEYLISELNKKHLLPLNVYKMADAKNVGAVSPAILEQAFKKFLPNVRNEIFSEAMNAFRVNGPRDLVSRSDFEAVFSPNTDSSKTAYIPHSAAATKLG